MSAPEQHELLELWSQTGAELCRELCNVEARFCHPAFTAWARLDEADPDALEIHQQLLCRRGCPMLSATVIDFVTPEIERQAFEKVAFRGYELDISMGPTIATAVDNN